MDTFSFFYMEIFSIPWIICWRYCHFYCVLWVSYQMCDCYDYVSSRLGLPYFLFVLLCQDHAVFITTAPQHSLKSGTEASQHCSFALGFPWVSRIFCGSIGIWGFFFWNSKCLLPMILASKSSDCKWEPPIWLSPPWSLIAHPLLQAFYLPLP